MLNDRQLRFVQEYLVDMNSTQAAIRAGYSARTAKQQGSRLLTNANVKAAVEARQVKVAAKLEVTQERVLRELAAIAFHDVRRLFRDDGSPKAPHELDDETAAAFAGVEIEELFERTGDGGREQIGRIHKIKRWDKPKALELLARHLGLFKDAGDGATTGPSLTVIVQQGQSVSNGEATQASRVVVSLPAPPSGR